MYQKINPGQPDYPLLHLRAFQLGSYSSTMIQFPTISLPFPNPKLQFSTTHFTNIFRRYLQNIFSSIYCNTNKFISHWDCEHVYKILKFFTFSQPLKRIHNFQGQFPNFFRVGKKRPKRYSQIFLKLTTLCEPWSKSNKREKKNFPHSQMGGIHLLLNTKDRGC